MASFSYQVHQYTSLIRSKDGFGHYLNSYRHCAFPVLWMLQLGVGREQEAHTTPAQKTENSRAEISARRDTTEGRCHQSYRMRLQQVDFHSHLTYIHSYYFSN